MNSAVASESPASREPPGPSLIPESPGRLPTEARLQELVGQIQNLPDPAVRELAQECLSTALELHGQGLARMLQLLQNAGAAGQPTLKAMLRDPLVRALLLIHGLHPVDVRTRLSEALEKVQPYLKSHGGNVELVGIENDVARVRFHGACKTCPASAVTMESAIRTAVAEACPELLGLELDQG
jgi:Fe-S cluster biogenesis protein NfuA